MGRTKNVATNAITGVIGQLLTIVMQFACRTVFIYTLSSEYLGIVGLFTNIISILSLSELGFGVAILYLIYKPIAENNKNKIIEYMNLYRVFYRRVALVVFGVGVCLIPFLKYFVGNSLDIHNVRLIYILYLFNSIASYLLIYKQSIIEASQKVYITIFYQKSFLLVQSILQIVSLLITKNFIIYLVIQLISTITCNLFISIKADKLFPYLNKDKKSLPSKDEIKEVMKNTLAMATHKMGSVVVLSTDNILMSAMVNIKSVGLYSNYTLITTTINAFINMIFNGFSASIGNFVASREQKQIYSIYKSVNFFGFWLVSFCATSLYNLLNPFIELWIGPKYLFNMDIVFIIVTNFYLNGMRVVTLKFRDAMGIFWYDRHKPIFESGINLLTSFILTKKFGVIGILLGTTISTLLTSFWIEPYVLYKYGFKEKIDDYYKKYMMYTVYFIVISLIINKTCYLFSNDILGFGLKLLFIVVVYNLLILLVLYKTEEFKTISNKIKMLILDRKKYSKQSA